MEIVLNEKTEQTLENLREKERKIEAMIGKNDKNREKKEKE